MDQENPPKDGNTFFSSGAYGCVHYPRIKCDGSRKSIAKGKRKDGLLSKLVLYDSKSKNEFLVGQKLKATKMLKNNPIVLVERKCEIKPKGAQRIVRGYKPCQKVLTRKKDKKYKYVLMFSKYYKSITVNNYIYNSSKFSVRRILKYFYFCVYVSNILKNFNIVHNDMHMNNVIYDEAGKFHLIDFGLSLDIDKIMNQKKPNVAYLRNSLVNSELKRTDLSIEQYILKFFVYEDRFLDVYDLKKIVNGYYNLLEGKKWLLDVDDFETHKSEVYEHYKNLFVNQTDIHKHIANIVERACHTWDLYRVSVGCLNAMKHFEHEISSTNFRLTEFKELLKSCLHYDYDMRPKQEKVLKTISSFSLI